MNAWSKWAAWTRCAVNCHRVISLSTNVAMAWSFKQAPTPILAEIQMTRGLLPMCLLNHALKGSATETVGSLHGGSHDGELRLVGWSADQWLKRLDVDDGDLPGWRETNYSAVSPI